MYELAIEKAYYLLRGDSIQMLLITRDVVHWNAHLPNERLFESYWELLYLLCTWKEYWSKEIWSTVFLEIIYQLSAEKQY